MANLPYVTATGNVERALTAIISASTPEAVSQDFVKTVLLIPGGSGNQMTSYLKRIGFVNTDGTPSDIYKTFRNPTTSKTAAAKALKIGYAPLYVRNEYMHLLNDEELRGLVIEETGQENDSNVVTLIVNCIKSIKKFADFSIKEVEKSKDTTNRKDNEKPKDDLNNDLRNNKVGLNLSYTINLNLPITSDIAVFNAIFKSLRDNLLKD